MAITGLLHVNINCSDFERSRAFYEVLGFEHFLAVAPTSTPEVAAAVGMPPYEVRGALMILRGKGQPVMLDLLEWRDPRDDSPPYPHLYHLGIARIAFATDDLDAEMARLKAHEVEFLSEPATVAITGAPVISRFVCFRDPDGTILELVQST